VPLGQHVRAGTTNQWVAQIVFIRAVGSEPTSNSVFLFNDIKTRQSTHWTLETWSIPGPWYVTLDAVSFHGFFGLPKIKRFTVVGAGYVPDDYEPELQ